MPNVYIDTIRLPRILETASFGNLSEFLSRTAFVISHKAEHPIALQNVLWFLPVDSPVIVVSNCPEGELESLRTHLRAELAHHQKLYVLHQKDARIAQFFKDAGVAHIFGLDDRVRDGKGEGMYIGALFAASLGYPRWVIFYDADNLAPSALLEYTLALSQLFIRGAAAFAYEASYLDDVLDPLHNVRICWSAKPEMRGGKLEFTSLGRCTSVISPLFRTLLEDWFDISQYPIISSNAGEQGLSIAALKTIRFSSAYSVETFQLLELLARAADVHHGCGKVIVQQYHAQSAHFHTKRGTQHIRNMIAQSLGSFLVFRERLPERVLDHITQVCDELSIAPLYPLVYPAIGELPVADSVSWPLSLEDKCDFSL